jgi:hypothetical protein
MTRPRLALVLDGPLPAALAPLLAALSTHCRPVAEVGRGATAALLAAPGLPRPPGARCAVWVRAVEGLGEIGPDDVVLATDAAVLRRAGRRAHVVPRSGAAAGAAPVTPFVRRRLRAARGLPEVAVVVADQRGWTWSGQPLADTRRDTALGLASAGALTDPAAVVRALAWGLPTVVPDHATAVALGVRAGDQVLVGADPAPAIARLVADDRLATGLSGRGQQWAHLHHDPPASAAALAGRLGLVGPGPVGVSSALLDELGTPAGARIRERLGEMVD